MYTFHDACTEDATLEMGDETTKRQPGMFAWLPFYYVNPQERKPQAQRDWQDLLQGRAHNVHEVDVCALSLLCRFSGTKKILYKGGHNVCELDGCVLSLI